jgi:hypothetical protein
MQQHRPEILILYSNPINTARLRVDKEHRAIDQIIDKFHIDSNRIVRLHATSVTDFIAELQKSDFEIIQFSGHGSTEGIYLETANINQGEVVSAKRVSTLLHGSSPKLKAVIFISCFSASSISDLIDIAPYLITVSGPAEDDAAIEFIRRFYETLFKSDSVELAFETAVRLVGAILERQGIHPVLSRRAKEKGSGRFLVQAFPTSGDSILIDLTDVEEDLPKLKISKDKFLSLLTRKIRAHQWVFDIPRERVVIPIGSYFGVFSWQNASDLVFCNKILQVKEEVDEITCKVWARVVLNYNDLYSAKYRSVARPMEALHVPLLETALENLKKFYKGYFLDEDNSMVLRSCIGRNYNTSSALIEANIELAEKKHDQGDYSTMIFHMENALSGIHDLVDTLTENLCE